MSAETAPQEKTKRPAVDIVAPILRANEAVRPYRLSPSRGINPSGYTVDVVGESGAKRELASGMTARELVAFLDGIVAAATFVGKAK